MRRSIRSPALCRLCCSSRTGPPAASSWRGCTRGSGGGARRAAAQGWVGPSQGNGGLSRLGSAPLSRPGCAVKAGQAWAAAVGPGCAVKAGLCCLFMCRKTKPARRTSRPTPLALPHPRLACPRLCVRPCSGEVLYGADSSFLEALAQADQYVYSLYWAVTTLSMVCGQYWVCMFGAGTTLASCVWCMGSPAAQYVFGQARR